MPPLIVGVDDMKVMKVIKVMKKNPIASPSTMLVKADRRGQPPPTPKDRKKRQCDDITPFTVTSPSPSGAELQRFLTRLSVLRPTEVLLRERECIA
eukprot:gene9736-biopygen5172